MRSGLSWSNAASAVPRCAPRIAQILRGRVRPMRRATFDDAVMDLFDGDLGGAR
jgi:hypothetical protein